MLFSNEIVTFVGNDVERRCWRCWRREEEKRRCWRREEKRRRGGERRRCVRRDRVTPTSSSIAIPIKFLSQSFLVASHAMFATLLAHRTV
jgi:hypothetical protein